MQIRVIAKWIGVACLAASCLATVLLKLRAWAAPTAITTKTGEQDKNQSHLFQTVAPNATTTRKNDARTVLIVPTAGRLDTMHLQNFRHVLRSFEKLTVTPDILVLYTDWGAAPTYGDMLLNNTFNLSFPVKVVTRPEDTMVLYPSHYYTGHLKMMVWWAMNDAFVTTGAEQVCYSEDDIAIHPDFFAWVKATRKEIPRGKCWSLFGTGSAISAPLCVDRFEWSYLLNFYQSFCYKEQGAWDMILFTLHQSGPLPPVRAETATPASIHLPYHQGENLTHLINTAFAKKLDPKKFVLKTPHYGNGIVEQTARSADLNFESFTQENNRAITKTQLFKIIECCITVALETRSKMEVATTLIPVYEYEEVVGKDIVGHDIISMTHEESDDDADALRKAKKICDKNADCFGFAHWRSLHQTWFKSNVSSAFLITAEDIKKDLVLFVKNCEYITPADHLCIPKFKYGADD